ncbi:hypothetical protein KIN20_000857 [Parelaphostrongylus tenuis]|uniref:Uncharacterized protein n=1 Tax=Parelaphostrongylus tenuis TaxID=148309 RepID=A0AAD5LW39_PARTN|nr:hypothetical protein KIN20_000857 [Parelaphostrongylus tenuis]
MVCAYHWYVLSEVNRRGDIRKMRTAMKKAKKALQCARDTMAAKVIVVLGYLNSERLMLTDARKGIKFLFMRPRENCCQIHEVMEQSRRCIRALNQWSAVELAVIATQAGMTLEQIEEEYCRDASARKEVLMSVLGGRKNAFVRKFVLNYPSRFLRNGYSIEKYFTHTHTEGSRTGGPHTYHSRHSG